VLRAPSTRISINFFRALAVARDLPASDWQTSFNAR